MYEQPDRLPILTLNLQINDLEHECIELYSINEIERKVDHFVRTYQITDTKLIKRLKARIKESLTVKYPFLAPKDDKENKKTTRTKQKITSAREVPLSSKIWAKKPNAENSVNKFGIQHIIYSKKTIASSNQITSNSHHKSKNVIKTPSNTSKFQFKNNRKNDENNENRDSKKSLKNTESIKPRENFDKNINSFLEQEHMIASVYNFNNPLLSYSYTNPNVIQPRIVPQTATNRSFMCRMADSEADMEPRSYMSSYSNAKMTKKSSFYEYSNHHDKRSSFVHDNQLKLHENRLKNDVADHDNGSILSFDNYVFKIIPKDQLKSIFDQFDSNKTGLIGPKNLNLRSLTAEHLKMLEEVVIEIFKKEPNVFFTFNDFCRLVKDHVKIEN